LGAATSLGRKSGLQIVQLPVCTCFWCKVQGLREEGAAQPLAMLNREWFGDLQQLSGSFKAIAASKEAW